MASFGQSGSLINATAKTHQIDFIITRTLTLNVILYDISGEHHIFLHCMNASSSVCFQITEYSTWGLEIWPKTVYSYSNYHTFWCCRSCTMGTPAGNSTRRSSWVRPTTNVWSTWWMTRSTAEREAHFRSSSGNLAKVVHEMAVFDLERWNEV